VEGRGPAEGNVASETRLLKEARDGDVEAVLRSSG
jgi:hypothetical protein